MAEKSINYWITQLSNGGWRDCSVACRQLGNIGDEIAMEPLARLLEHNSSHVREAAIDAFRAPNKMTPSETDDK